MTRCYRPWSACLVPVSLSVRLSRCHIIIIIISFNWSCQTQLTLQLHSFSLNNERKLDRRVRQRDYFIQHTVNKLISIFVECADDKIISVHVRGFADQPLVAVRPASQVVRDVRAVRQQWLQHMIAVAHYVHCVQKSQDIGTISFAHDSPILFQVVWKFGLWV